MEKKKIKKFLKKAAKAALIGGALYAGAKGLKARGMKGNVSKTAAMEDANIGVKHFPGKYIEKKPKIASPDFDWRLPMATAAKGGRIGKKDGGRTRKQFGGGLNRPVARPVARPVGGVGGVGAPVRPLAYKHGGKVKSMGIAKRGGGVAKR